MVFGMFLYPFITVRLKKTALKKNTKKPKVTVIIPVYNEEKLISSKLENILSLDYPKNKLDIIVVENGSTDETAEAAKKFPVRLLHSSKGKIRAINKGLKCSNTDIVITTDVDVKLSKNSIESLVSCFTEGIGAVNGYIIGQAMNPFTKQKETYKKADWELRYEEGLMDTACSLDGKLMAFRKSIIPQIPKDALVDDYILTLLMREKGYRSVVDKEAQVYEPLSENMYSEIKQFKRFAITGLITNFKNIHFLFNPRYGYFGMMTFPFRRFFPIFYPVFLVYIIIYLFFINPVISVSVLGLGFFFLLMFKRLILIQLIAVITAYPQLFMKKNLKGGSWNTIR